MEGIIFSSISHFLRNQLRNTKVNNETEWSILLSIQYTQEFILDHTKINKKIGCHLQSLGLPSFMVWQKTNDTQNSIYTILKITVTQKQRYKSAFRLMFLKDWTGLIQLNGTAQNGLNCTDPVGTDSYQTVVVYQGKMIPLNKIRTLGIRILELSVVNVTRKEDSVAQYSISHYTFPHTHIQTLIHNIILLY